MPQNAVGAGLMGAAGGSAMADQMMIATGNAPIFDSVTLQGSMNKEDYSDLCSYLINKTSAISFLSCQVDFKKIQFAENLDKLRAIQVRGDSELMRMSNLLDRVWGLKRLDYIGVSSFDQLLRYEYKQRLP